MKKIFYTLIALGLFLPTAAFAATLSLSPDEVTLKPGEVVNVTVYVNPSAGESITVAKLSAEFSADTLEVLSFIPESGWIMMPTADSDLIDNTAGKIVKTGGYPARVTSPMKFGILTIKAKADGSGILMIKKDDSMLLDSTNANKLSAADSAQFTIKTPVPKPKPKPQVKPSAAKNEQTETSTVEKVQNQTVSEPEEEQGAIATTTEEVSETVSSSTPPAIDASQQKAAVKDATEWSPAQKTIAVGAGIILVLLIGFMLLKRKRVI